MSCSLWRFAAETPGCSYVGYLTLEQEGSEPDLPSTDLCEQGALVFKKVVVFLKSVVREHWPRGRGGGPAMSRRLSRLLPPAPFPVNPQDILRDRVFRPGLSPVSSAFTILEGEAWLRRLDGGSAASARYY